MVKKHIEVAPVEARTSALLSYTEADATAAQSLGIILAGSLQDRISRAVHAFNMAARFSVESGYLLLSVKGEVAHGEFEAGLDALGFSQRRAQELMQMAKFATSLPAERRAEMLTLPKSKLLLLAGADASVVEDLLDNPDQDFADLSVRGLREKLRELEARLTDTAVERDTVVAERDGLAKQLRRRRAEEAEGDGGVPLAVADVRAEIAELLKKGELAFTSLHPLGVEVVNMVSLPEGGEWVKPTLRLALSGIVALRLQADGLIGQFVQVLGEDAKKLASHPDALAFLDETEIKGVAEDWQRLTALHQHEQALRAHEREQAHPKGKGRPSAPPKAPKAAKA